MPCVMLIRINSILSKLESLDIITYSYSYTFNI